MNVYDFDGTLYDGDSSIDFYKFCLRRHPGVLACLPGQVAAWVRYKRGRCTKTQMKERFYRYFRHVPDVPAEVRAFWEGPARARLKRYYQGTRRDDDVVASASPDWLIAPGCALLGVADGRVIGTQVDPATGVHASENCRDVEKVRRVRAAFPDEPIECAYSDSRADDPLAAAAQRAYLVKGEQLLPWPAAGGCGGKQGVTGAAGRVFVTEKRRTSTVLPMAARVGGRYTGRQQTRFRR